jgi:hypothetical protein
MSFEKNRFIKEVTVGKLEIKIIDSLFSHVTTVGSVFNVTPKYFTWNRHTTDSNLVVFTDNDLEKAKDYNCKYKVAWLVESPLITNACSRIINLEQHFDKIITFNEELLKRSSKYCNYSLGGCWIKEEDRNLYNKNKLVSMITSSKSITAPQRLRNNVVTKYRNNIDIYGRGYNEIPYKLQAHKDYCFSVVMENCNSNFYFSEKLIDCFMCGTIPVYYGCEGVTNFFDKRGMIIFNSIDELDVILKSLTFEKYELLKEYSKINFETAKKYCVVEDNLWEHLKLFLKL